MSGQRRVQDVSRSTAGTGVWMPLQPLVAGHVVTGAVCVRKKTPGTTKAGQAYVAIEVGNATGSVTARIWSKAVGAWDGIEVGHPVHVEGRLTTGWRDGPPELQVTRVEPLVASADNGKAPLLRLNEQLARLLVRDAGATRADGISERGLLTLTARQARMERRRLTG